MLVTNPSLRATLTEVMNHPWMQRGYTGPPDSHLPEREPLRPPDIDMAVVKMMTGFEFGEPRDIERKLRDVLESELYKRAVDLWERRRVAKASSTWGRAGESPSSSTTAFNSMQSLRDLGYESPASPTKKNTGSRRFSGFDFYRKKLFSPGSSPPSTPMSKSPPGSNPYGVPMGAQGAGEGGQRGEPADPTKGFHPLISIYFLCKEKMERERIYGPTFASSQLSLNPPHGNVQQQSVNAGVDPASVPAPPPSAYKPAPTLKSTPQPIQVPPGVQRAEYNSNSMPVHVPRVPVPEATHYSGTSYDAPVPTSPNAAATVHPQPRARATDFPEQATTPSPPHGANYGTIGAPAPAKHRRSHSIGTRPTVPRAWDGPSAGPGTAKPSTVQEGEGEGEPPEGSKTAGPAIPTFAERYRGEGEPRWSEQAPGVEVHVQSQPQPQQQQQQQPTREGGTLRSKFGSLLRKEGGLGRRSSVLRGIAGSRTSTDAGTVVAKEEERDRERDEKENVAPGSAQRERGLIDSGAQTDIEGGPRLTLSASQPIGQVHRRAATILDPMGRPGRHERRSSMGAGLGFPFVGTLGRRPKTGVGAAATTEDATPSAAAMAEGKEKALLEGNETEREREERTSSEEATVKPVYLKGLFRCVFVQVVPDGRPFLTTFFLFSFYFLGCSVATTSTKPPAVIKADIRRVLDRMQVQYREIRGGFECLHMPSIDLASVIADAQAHQQHAAGAQESGSRRITRKASKLSFGPRKKEKDTGSVREEKQPPTQPAVSGKEGEQQANNVTSVSGGSSSFFNIIPSQELPDHSDQQQPGEPTEAVAVKANGSVHSLEELPEEIPVNATAPQEQDPNLLSPSQSAQAGANATTSRPVSPTRNKFLPPIPRDFATQQTQEQQKVQGTVTSKTSGAGGNTAPPTPFVGPLTPTPGPGGSITIDDLFEMSSGSELVVRFEINILKVPLLPLHGIQFRRVGGDGWQYHMLARRVLTELKL